MKLHIIRHGEPDYARDCLTPLGQTQAMAILDLPWINGVKRIYSSPLGRAVDTAEAVARGVRLPARVLPWLREMDEVVVWDERRPDLAVWNLDPERLRGLEEKHWLNSGPFSGTPLAGRWDSLREGADKIMAEYAVVRRESGWRTLAEESADEAEIAIFCHLGVGLTLIAYLLEVCPLTLWRSAFLAPASVTTLLLERRAGGRAGFRLLRLGDISHLVKNNIEAGTAGLQYNTK